MKHLNVRFISCTGEILYVSAEVNSQEEGEKLWQDIDSIVKELSGDEANSIPR